MLYTYFSSKLFVKFILNEIEVFILFNAILVFESKEPSKTKASPEFGIIAFAFISLLTNCNVIGVWQVS